jgi:hypothetical protein
MALSTIDELSGGQFQRMLFARVMVQQAPLVMLDEPFTGVDEATCNVLMELMLEMHQQGQTCWRCCMTASAWRATRKRCGWMLPFPISNRAGEGGMIWHLFSSRLLNTALCAARWWCAWRCLSAPPLGVFLCCAA